MGANSAIEWTDHTFNPWTGCQRVSPGCDHCYAEALSKRAPRTFGSWLPGGPRKRTSEDYWKQPLRWNRRAEKEGVRRRVFCASMADVFDNQPPIAWLADLLDVIRITPALDWLLLTKRPQLIVRRLEEAFEYIARGTDRADLVAWLYAWLRDTAPANVWLGTTAENQEEADRRIPVLLQVPATLHFLSCEPLLGSLDLTPWMHPLTREHDGLGASLIGWVICGGESGPSARPMSTFWARSLRDQCRFAGVPFFFKQWGEWVDHDQAGSHTWQRTRESGGKVYGRLSGGPLDRIEVEAMCPRFDGVPLLVKAGKERSGALLDRREWREVPHA